MLSVVQRAISHRGENLADDEEGVAVESVGRGSGHDDRACEVEACEDDGEVSAAPFVDAVAEGDAEEGVHLSGGKQRVLRSGNT